jgi:hypothetical protein
MGFPYPADARKTRFDLRKRETRCGLTLHEIKSRLIKFGRLTALDRRRHRRTHDREALVILWLRNTLR